MKTILKIIKWTFLSAIAFVTVVVIIGSFLPKPPPAVAPQTTDNSGGAQAAEASNTAPAAQAPAAATKPASTIPPDEQNFVNIVAQATSDYGQAANDMAKGAVRHQRRVAICQAFKSTNVTGWAGTISDLDSTGKGNGVLAVQLNSNLTLTTYNNDLSDSMGPQTTIPAGSPLFTQVSQMKTGDTVIFSGSFLPSDNDCFEEQSLTTDGGMNSPSFTFRFTFVKESP